MAFGVGEHGFGGSFKQNSSAAVTTFGAEVYDVVGYFYYVEIVFYYEDGIAAVNEFVQYVEQVLYVLEMQAGCWLVEDIKCFAGISFCKFGAEFYALCLATTEGYGRLAEGDITKADILQHFYFAVEIRHGTKNSTASSTVISSTSLMDLPL